MTLSNGGKNMNINEEIKMLNDKAKTFNNKRQQAMGAKAIAEENYKKAVEAYADKYGVTLTKENFEGEYTRVWQALQESMAKLKKQIEDIESGKYKENVNLPSVSSESEEKNVESTRVEDEMPFDGGVEVTKHKGITIGAEVKMAEPVVSNTVPEVGVTPITPIIKPMQTEPVVQPSVVIKPMQAESPEVSSVTPVVTPIIKPMQVEQSPVTSHVEPTPIIKPMDIKIEDDEENAEDEDIPNLTWNNNAGVSLADFKGFSL